jgi:hypothetical protein
LKTVFLVVSITITIVASAIAGEAELKTCRGVLTENWIQGVAVPHPDNGTRLIRGYNIDNSCLFVARSIVGRQILRVCRMGFACQAQVALRDDPADVRIIDRVISVQNLNRRIK